LKIVSPAKQGVCHVYTWKRQRTTGIALPYEVLRSFLTE
jgi:hypothetical protein